MRERLGIEDSFVEDMGEVKIRRVYERRAKLDNEVMVTFEANRQET